MAACLPLRKFQKWKQTFSGPKVSDLWIKYKEDHKIALKGIVSQLVGHDLKMFWMGNGQQEKICN